MSSPPIETGPPTGMARAAAPHPILQAPMSRGLWWLQAVMSALHLMVEVVTVIPYFFICLLSGILPLQTRLRVIVQWPRAMLHVLSALCRVRWQVIGQENLSGPPSIILSKHQSTWETFWLAGCLPHRPCFVFKRELLNIPFFGWGLGLMKMIHIDRSRGRDAFEQLRSQGVDRLAEGRWIILFPEGTRVPPGMVGDYKTGGARLAIQTHAPVVPMAVNAGHLWPRGQFVKRPGSVTVSFGPPIDPTGRTPEEITLTAQTWIEGEMRRLNPEHYPQPETPFFRRERSRNRKK